MDDAGDDVVRDDDQPQVSSEHKTTKTLNPDWFTQPPRPPTPNSKWNKHQVVLDQSKQPWFNQMVYATKDPLTFEDLMATPIDFSKMYTTSITKTKAARYDIEGIEDMVPMLWGPTKVGKKILRVKSVSVKKLHGYSHLEEIVLFLLTNSDIVDFLVALRMFTRSLVIKKRVEDLQLGVESYQKKLNITPPQQTFPERTLHSISQPTRG
ncbi:hypothetical protein Tco_0278127 [Tanacetum coccineum]